MVFIDPGYQAFYKNEMFNEESSLNRDGQFAPGILLKERLAQQGIALNTADYLLRGELTGKINIYSSMGILANYKKFLNQDNVFLQSFYIIEGPNTVPLQYWNLRSLVEFFDKVYVLNTEGIGYEKCYDSRFQLQKTYFPEVQEEIIEELWNNKKRGFITLINSNKLILPMTRIVKRKNGAGFPLRLIRNPGTTNTELYSERLRALVAFQKLGDIDLYGYGWDTSFSKNIRDILKTQQIPYMYWRYKKELMSIYRGTVKSKYETLSKYRFSFCFENMAMPGWITEKIFDCIYVGTVPIYLGAPDIGKYIPKNCFIDIRDFSSYKELYEYLKNLSNIDIETFKNKGKEYLTTEQYKSFTKESFVEQFEKDLIDTLNANGVQL
ncbi:glycosyltransferase family 10 domain-containing protein [Chloroflexota bacterium]